MEIHGNRFNLQLESILINKYLHVYYIAMYIRIGYVKKIFASLNKSTKQQTTNMTTLNLEMKLNFSSIGSSVFKRA